MKKYTYFGIAALAMTFAACSNEDILDNNQPSFQGKFSVKAVMDNGDTRVSATHDEENSKHILYWQKNDEIGVYNGTNVSKMTTDTEGGTKEATFSTTEAISGTVTTAVYPYNALHRYEETTWTLQLPASYDCNGAYTGNVNTPMIAEVVANENAQTDGISEISELRFRHVGGAIRFDVASLPADANEVTLTLPGKKINGEFEVADGVIVNADSENVAEQSVSIKFTQSGEGEQSSVFFFPVPTGEYSGLKFEVKKDNEVLYSYDRTPEFTIARADMGLYPVITIGGEPEDLLNMAKAGGGTFTLSRDIEVKSFEVEENVDLTIDLNGHTLSCAAEGGNVIIVNKGKLTVKDSSNDKAGQITAQVSIGYAPSKEGYDGGEFVLESGTVTGGADNGRVVVGKNGKFTMKGGKVINTGYNFAIGTNNLSNSSDASISLYSGTVESKEDYAIFVADNVNVSINETATVKGQRGCIAIDKGSLEIFNGTFESECLGEPTGTSGSGSFPGAIIAAPAYYGNVSVKIYGGTFNGKNGVSTKKVGDRTGQGSEFKTTVTVTGGEWQDPEVLNYAAEGNEIKVTMVADKEIKRFINLKNNSTSTIDFNGYKIINRTHDTSYTNDAFNGTRGFIITGSNTKVTFKDSSSEGNGGIEVDASSITSDGHRHAIWVYLGASVTIEGGSYTNDQGVDEVGIDLIQVGAGNGSDTANLTIKGGVFESKKFSIFGNKSPRYWVINKHNQSPNCTISIEGGEFVNWNPAKPDMDDETSYLAANKTVTVKDKDGNVVENAADESYVVAVADKDEKRLIYTVVDQSAE